MSHITLAQRWWQFIPGPSRLIELIIDHIHRGNSILFMNNAIIPWQEQMVRNIKELGDESHRIHVIDAQTIPQGTGLGEYLMHNYGSESLHKLSFLGKEDPYLKYLGKNSIFEGKVFWFQHVSSSQLIEWLPWIKSFCVSSLKNGSIILETLEDISKFHSNKAESRFFEIDVNDVLTPLDTYLFSSVLLTENNSIDNHYIGYFADIAANISHLDALLAAKISSTTQVTEKDPLSLIRGLFEEEKAADSTYFHTMIQEPVHPFYHLNIGNEMELKFRIWKAQIQAIYPVIEAERIRIVQLKEENLKRCLPFYNPITKENIEEAMGLELSMLKFLHLDETDNPNRILLNKKQSQRLFLLKELRDRLSHQKHCTWDEIKAILSQKDLWVSK